LVRNLLQELGACGTEFLSIGGGEPLMYRELPDVISAAREAGLEVEVTTNGSLASPARVARLQESGLRFVQLSLDGATAGTFESIRKSGRFEQVLENAQHLAGAFTLTVSTVALRENLSEMPALIDLAKVIGASYFRVIPLMPSGRGRTVSAPSVAQMRALHELVRERQRTESAIVVQFNENILDEPLRRAMGAAGQHRARTHFSAERFVDRAEATLRDAFHGRIDPSPVAKIHPIPEAARLMRASLRTNGWDRIYADRDLFDLLQYPYATAGRATAGIPGRPQEAPHG
jgi:MoaA/NifB/PqqE/SkfB family radical SAM enzyme